MFSGRNGGRRTTVSPQSPKPQYRPQLRQSVNDDTRDPFNGSERSKVEEYPNKTPDLLFYNTIYNH